MPSAKRNTQRSKHGWKDVQSKTRIKKRTKLALIVLGLILGLLLLSWIIRTGQQLFGTNKNYTWDQDYNINLLIRAKDFALVSYHPKESSIVIVNIPEDTFLDVPYGFGSWQLRSVYGLGESQKGIGGNKLLTDTLTNFLAVPIDGYLDFSASNQNLVANIMDQWKSNPLSGLSLLSGVDTNLTAWELFKLTLSLNSVRFDKVKEINLNKLGILDKDTLLDGTQVLTSDFVKLDSALIGLVDPAIVSERKSIAVLNATDYPQLAQKWARLITNLGGNVIITANAGLNLKKTQVIGEDSKTFKRLQQVFGFACQKDPKCDKVNPENLDSQRAQITVLLGEDFAGK